MILKYMCSFSHMLVICLSMFLYSSEEQEKQCNKPLKWSKYVVLLENNSAEETQVQRYLFEELVKRNINFTPIVFNKPQEDALVISLKLNKNYQYDYHTWKKNNELYVIAKDLKTLTWISNQIISKISESDTRIKGHDLPPSTINFNQEKVNFSFDYREPFLQPNTVKHAVDIFNTNSLDVDWGIWGHNLSKLLKGNVNDDVFAEINFQRNRNQICFSSKSLYKIVENHIIENFGDGVKKRSHFMIMPKDNHLVCTCRDCIMKGNTKHDASPSVYSFISLLSKKFPKHNFYTSVYNTTKSIPKAHMPKNTGVIISAIDLLENNKRAKQFFEQIHKWKLKTDNILIWDYIANFDDYFTPHSFLFSLQERLKMYASLQVNGLFLNGAGYEYSVFQEVQHYVASVLLMNKNADIQQLVEKYFAKNYPISSTFLSNYYLALEQRQTNKAQGVYYSIQSQSSIVDYFIQFYKKIPEYISKSKFEEKQKLKKLQYVLSYTYLQTMLSKKFQVNGYAKIKGNTIVLNEEFLKTLKEVKQQVYRYKKIKTYKEVTTPPEEIIKNIEQKILIQNNSTVSKLKDKKIIAKSKTDENQDIRLLTDGVLGLPHNYHEGWFIHSIKTDLLLQLPIQYVKKGTLRVNFLEDPKLNIFAPKKVEITKNGVRVAFLQPTTNDVTRAKNYTITCQLADIEGEISIHIIKQPNKNKIALDEITLL